MMTMISHLLVGHWVTLHGLIMVMGLTVYVAASHTLHQRRHPSAAIAWVVSLVLLPYVALPFYLMFGTRKVAGYRSTARKFESSNWVFDPDSASARTQQLAAAMALPSASSYRELNIHDDGRHALQALRDMIDGATRSIDLCTFVFARDGLGDEIAQRLKQRARDGMRVRLLVDGVGAYLGGHRNFKSLSAEGVQVALFVPPLRSPLRGRTNLRNHRKMVIVDNSWLWCGGRNIAAEYFEGDTTSVHGSPPWADLSFDLHGALALQAQQQFEQDWDFATKGIRPDLAPSISQTLPAGTTIGQLIASGPDQTDDTLYTLLVSGFFTARNSITAVTPYFVPDPTLLMSLTLAARRGVKVDILMPRKSNHRLADLARHRALRDITSAGVHVWFLPHMIHAKAVVIDAEIALVGSANLDERSLFLNYELMVSFYEPNDVQRFAQWIEHQRNTAVPYRAQPPGVWREIAEGLLLWLAFQL